MSLWDDLERTAPLCGECGEEMLLRSGRFGSFWSCSQWPSCTGTHGAHPDGTPLGVPANEATKDARVRAHDAFDRLWKGGKMRRNDAYCWMQETLGLTAPEAHIGRFSEADCQRLIEEVDRYLLND